MRSQSTWIKIGNGAGGGENLQNKPKNIVNQKADLEIGRLFWHLKNQQIK